MVGSAAVRALKTTGMKNILTPSRRELDLRDDACVDVYFDRNRPEIVFMIAAKVGGIAANISDPVGFLAENARMTVNLFEACHKYGTRKNLFLGSSCIYPRECPQPMREEYLMTGPLEPTNEGYAFAKIMGLKLAQYYFDQYGMNTVCPMPSNIYGSNDHYDYERSHVLSALVMRFVDAVDNRQQEVVCWGTGVARREFVHVDDVADAMFFLMENYDTPDIVNVGAGSDVSIKELALMVAEAAGYGGEISWDPSKPDGMPRKCMDISKLERLGFKPKITLEEGIANTVAEYRALKSAGKIGTK